MGKERKIIVIGHKNPDTDSICSAISYARLKCILTGKQYVPRRAGHVNQETKYVLDRFGVEAPEYETDISTQVKDIEIRETKGVTGDISLKKAWNLMEELGVVSLPITENKKLIGLITVGDIATSYMDVYDSKILAKANTQYKNIIETLDAEIIVGSEEDYFNSGKVLVAAANPDLMESYIEENDLVILGNRYESQLCAIEMSAGCIIVCEGAPVSRTIKKLANDKGCTIIVTPHDTYTTARLVNQSMPIAYFMRRDNLVTFRTDDRIDAIKDIMAKKRHRDFPILDNKGDYMGMISRRNLLDMKRKQVVLVDHNEKTQAVDGLDDAEILEIIDHHRLGALETMQPVFFRNQPLGCTATIIYQLYTESGISVDEQTAGLLCAAIISDTLMFRSPTCTIVDKNAAKILADIAKIDIETFAAEMFSAGSNLKHKSPEEIFYQDFKKFSTNEVTFGVGQINSMNGDELQEIKQRLIPYMEKALSELGVDMLFFMLTDIINESTELIFQGNNSKETVATAYSNAANDGESYMLPGVVSRKKQLIPSLMMSLSQ